MIPEKLTDDLRGKEVRAYVDSTFKDARVILSGWSSDKRSVFVTAASEYGKRFPKGTRVQVPVENVRVPRK